jgi:transcriptional regulator with XRE-family HTH domain
VIETLSKGLSLTAFAGEIGVSRDTINEWRRNYPEFSVAVNKATAKRVLWLENRLYASTLGPQVTSTIFALKNADPDEWREKQQLEHSGPGGDAIQTVTRIELVAPGDGDNQA